MSLWAWIAVSLSGILVLSFFLFRIRYSVVWNGGLDFSGSFKYGFPGFTRVLSFPEKSSAPPVPSAEKTPEPQTAKPSQTTPTSRPGSGRGKRMLRRFLLDPVVWRALFRYGWRFARLTFRLLHLELDCAIGHSDPARLGRLAGYWHAAEPLLPARRVRVHFRFQDPRSSLRVSLQGGFSAAQGLAYAFMALFSFPWFTLSRRAWHGWRNS